MLSSQVASQNVEDHHVNNVIIKSFYFCMQRAGDEIERLAKEHSDKVKHEMHSFKLCFGAGKCFFSRSKLLLYNW